MSHRHTETLSTNERQEREQPTLQRRAKELVSYTASEGNYGQLRNADGLSHQDALQQATAAIAADYEKHEISQADASLVDLLGRAGGFIESQDALRQDADILSYEEGRELKDQYIIPFNQSLKEFINHHPSLSIGDLTKTLTSTYIGAFQQYSNYDNFISNDTIYESFRGIAEGIRHEIAAETLLDSIGVDTRYETEDGGQLNDRKGEDLRVYLDEETLNTLFEGADWHDYLDNETYQALINTWHSIDIKSSETAEARSHAQHPDNIAAWTGLYDSDFKGPKNNTPGSLTTAFPSGPDKGRTFLIRIIESATGAIQYRSQR